MQPEKIVYPIVHDSCPVCGSTKRHGQDAIQELKGEGRLHKDALNEGFAMTQIPLIDQTRPPAVLLTTTFKIPLALAYWDVCASCGTMYCSKFDVKEVPAQLQKGTPPPPPPGMPPFREHNGLKP